MSKEKKEEVLDEVVAPKSAKSDREIRFAKHLEIYKARNPVKFAIKEKNGEFEKIPASFV